MLPCDCLIRLSCYLCVNKGWTGTSGRIRVRFSSQVDPFATGFRACEPLSPGKVAECRLGARAVSSRFEA